MQSSAGAGTNNGSELYYREKVISIAAQDRNVLKNFVSKKKYRRNCTVNYVVDTS